jgi:Coenzyme PQQ synthesis protein D (PqqD)
LTSPYKRLRAILNQDGAAILEPKSGRISTLNSTGAIVWQALERGEDTETIAQSLARQTGEEIEAVRKDVADFVEALKKQNLLPC